MGRLITIIGILFLLSRTAFAEEKNNISGNKADSLALFDNKNYLSDTSIVFLSPFIQRVEFESRLDYIIPTHTFLRGENESGESISRAYSAHVRYSFQFRPDTYAGRIFGEPYQGIGFGYFTSVNPEELGNPIALYLFQGARIHQFTSRLSLNYEWNFGLSFGWKPYDYEWNRFNTIIGSKTNAYLNANVYLNWALSPLFDLTSGITLTHFSNGNTKLPNAGLNSVGLKVGLVYNFNRKNYSPSKSFYEPPLPDFFRHISYDLVLFGSWRRKLIDIGKEETAVLPDSYKVFGFNFNPMYNLGYKLRVGISADGVFDESANVYTEDYITGTVPTFSRPSTHKQLALGFSGRLEYVMPYFTIGMGIGANVLHGGGDLKFSYQLLTLKIQTTRNSFIHIGYNLRDFHDPNFLMLGVGFRFNNKYPDL